MRPTSSNFITSKNSQECTPIYLYTIYNYNGEDDNLYFACSSENVVFDGVTYTAFPIMHESVSENSNGEIDKVQIKVANANLLIQGYLENYSWQGLKVVIKTVFLDKLADTTAFLDDEYYIDSYSADEKAASFVLSSKFDILDVSIPGRIFSRNYCTWRFKGLQCGYAGAETSCGKTFQRCRELNNQKRFGGFPAIPMRKLVIS